MKTHLTQQEALRALFMRSGGRSWIFIGAMLDVSPYRLRLQVDPDYEPARPSFAKSEW